MLSNMCKIRAHVLLLFKQIYREGKVVPEQAGIVDRRGAELGVEEGDAGDVGAFEAEDAVG